MKKLFLTLITASVMLAITCMPQLTLAQNAPQRITTINTQYMLPADSAGVAERTALVKEYFDKVTMKNQYIIHEWSMVHYYTDDSREFVTIDEFASWDDVAKADARFSELEKQAWPDGKQRKAFLDKMSKYFSYHKDAIYHPLDGMTK